MSAQDFFNYLYDQRDPAAAAPVPGMPRSLGTEDFELLERVFAGCISLDDLSLYVFAFTLFVHMRRSEKDTEGKKKYEGRLYALDEGLFVKALSAMVPARTWARCAPARGDFAAAVADIAAAVHHSNQQLHLSAAATATATASRGRSERSELAHYYPHFVNFIYHWSLKDHKADAAAATAAERSARVETACELWALLLYPAAEEGRVRREQAQLPRLPFSHYVPFLYAEEWRQYVQDAEAFGREYDISQDLFDEIQLFARQGVTVEQYSVESSSWPVAIDDFVVWVLKRRGEGGDQMMTR